MRKKILFGIFLHNSLVPSTDCRNFFSRIPQPSFHSERLKVDFLRAFKKFLHRAAGRNTQFGNVLGKDDSKLFFNGRTRPYGCKHFKQQLFKRGIPIFALNVLRRYRKRLLASGNTDNINNACVPVKNLTQKPVAVLKTSLFYQRLKRKARQHYTGRKHKIGFKEVKSRVCRIGADELHGKFLSAQLKKIECGRRIKFNRLPGNRNALEAERQSAGKHFRVGKRHCPAACDKHSFGNFFFCRLKTENLSRKSRRTRHIQIIHERKDIRIVFKKRLRIFKSVV